MARGLKYYNLDSKYDNDASSKGCGLTKHEIDTNFYNLRSADIKDVRWDNETGKLVIEFVDGKKIELGNIDPYNLDFNPAKQALVGKLPNGMSFLISSGVITDSSLEGDNTFLNPLSVARHNRTGFMVPVNSIVTELPETDGINGARYLLIAEDKATRIVYTAEEIQMIKDYLKEQKCSWRVADNNDWSKLLNASEPCDDDKNHEDFGMQGRIAGDLLKDNHRWNGYNPYGFSILPAEGKAVYASFSDDYNGYRFFNNESGEVYYLVSGETEYSIRLTKDGVYHSHETILDTEYECVKCPAWKDEQLIPTVWTSEDFSLREINGTKIGREVKYDNTGSCFWIVERELPDTWHRFKLYEGESFYCIADATMYTVVFTDGKWSLRTLSDLYNQSISNSYFDSKDKKIWIEFTENNNIQKISLNVESLIDFINKTISEGGIDVAEKLAEIREELIAQIEDEKNARKKVESNLADEVNTRKTSDDVISAVLNNEINERKKAVEGLINAMATESQARKDADNEAKEKLNKLDTRVSNLESGSATNERFEKLEERVDILESGSATNERFEKLEERVDALESGSATNERFEVVEERLSEVESATSSNQQQVEELQQGLEEANERIDDLSAITASADTEEIKEEIEEIKDALFDIISGGTAMDANSEYAIAGALNTLRLNQLNILDRLSKLEQ